MLFWIRGISTFEEECILYCNKSKNEIEELNMDKNLIDTIRRIKNQVVNGDANIYYYLKYYYGRYKGIKPPNGIREIIPGGKTIYTSDLPGVGED